jgi:hypothetical protein
MAHTGRGSQVAVVIAAATLLGCPPHGARTEYDKFRGANVTRAKLSSAGNADATLTHVEGQDVLEFAVALWPRVQSDLPRRCVTLEWSLDDKPLATSPATYEFKLERESFREVLTVTVPRESAPSLERARSMAWRACKFEHELSPPDLEAVRDFARKVLAGAPVGTASP